MMMSNRIRIVSDGCVQGTRVLMPDGTEIPNVAKVVIGPIGPIDGAEGRGPVRAVLYVAEAALDLTAEVPDPGAMHRDGADFCPGVASTQQTRGTLGETAR